MSFWWLILFFIDNFFIFRLKSVICKTYTNTNGKESKHINAIDISIILSCGGGGSGGGVGSAGSFIACIGSISATFFCIIYNTLLQLIHVFIPAFACCLNRFWVFCDFF